MSEYDIVMAAPAWDKFWQLTHMTNNEIGAFGYCEPVECDAPYLYVSEIFLVPQIVSGAEVDFVEEGIPYAVEKASKEGKLDQLRFWIHSHVNMSVYFSSIDTDAIKKMGEAGIPWLASTVFNQKGEHSSRIDIFNVGELPGLGQVTVKATVMGEADPILERECREEIEEFVKERKFQAPTKTPLAWTSPNGSEGIKTERITKLGDTEVIDAQTADEAARLWEAYDNEEFDFGYDDKGTAFFWDQSGNYRGSCPAHLDTHFGFSSYDMAAWGGHFDS